MEIESITNEQEYEDALAQIEKLMEQEESDAVADTRLAALVLLLMAWEEKHNPVGSTKR